MDRDEAWQDELYWMRQEEWQARAEAMDVRADYDYKEATENGNFDGVDE